MIMLQLPAFPKGQYFEWEKELQEWHSIGLAWHRYSSLGVLEGMGFVAETSHFSKIV